MKSPGPIPARGVEQTVHLLTCEEVRHKRRWSSGGRRGQRDVLQQPMTHGIPIESAQGRMLSMPIARDRPVTVQEGLDALDGSLGNGHVWTHGATERAQELCRGTEIRPDGLAKRDVLRDGLVGGRHTSPSRLKSATCLRPTRSTFAYPLVVAGFRCPRWSPISLIGSPWLRRWVAHA